MVPIDSIVVDTRIPTKPDGGAHTCKNRVSLTPCGRSNRYEGKIQWVSGYTKCKKNSKEEEEMDM